MPAHDRCQLARLLTAKLTFWQHTPCDNRFVQIIVGLAADGVCRCHLDIRYEWALDFVVCPAGLTITRFILYIVVVRIVVVNRCT